MHVKIKDKPAAESQPRRVVANDEQLCEGDTQKIFKDKMGDTCIVASNRYTWGRGYTVVWLDAGRREYPLVVQDQFPLTEAPVGTKITLKQER